MDFDITTLFDAYRQMPRYKQFIMSEDAKKIIINKLRDAGIRDDGFVGIEIKTNKIFPFNDVDGNVIHGILIDDDGKNTVYFGTRKVVVE